MSFKSSRQIRSIPKTNAFSGTTVVVPLGEGILNFCYADFKSAFDRCAAVYQELTRTADDPKKIHRIEEGVIHLYELYAEVFPTLSEVFYSSIYTAAFPPQFTRKAEKAFTYYQQYLSLLQSEFLELIEFCLDKNYRPKVLSIRRNATASGVKSKACPPAISVRRLSSRIPAIPTAQKCPLALNLIK